LAAETESPLEFNHHASVLPAPHHALKFEHQEAARMTIRPDVSVGSNSEVGGRNREVRFTPESRLNSDIAACPKGAKKRHHTLDLK
jgi:hypothetical protein